MEEKVIELEAKNSTNDKQQKTHSHVTLTDIMSIHIKSILFALFVYVAYIISEVITIAIS